MTWYKKTQNNKIELFRGVGGNGQVGNYYTPDKEWARQFTQSGRDEEIKSIVINDSEIYKNDPLPKAYGFDENDLNIIIQKALQLGFKAIWVDEGTDQPNSVFFINKV